MGLPSGCRVLLDGFFKEPEKLFDRVQPWGVLCGEEENGFAAEHGVDYSTMVVDRGIVHEQHHPPANKFWTFADMHQQPVDEVVKDSGVHSSLN